MNNGPKGGLIFKSALRYYNVAIEIHGLQRFYDPMNVNHGSTWLVIQRAFDNQPPLQDQSIAPGVDG